MARDVRDGKIDLPLLPILYELPQRLQKNGDWEQRKYWPCVNPNLNRSVNEDFLERELLKARNDAGQMALIASQHFNVQVGMNLRGDRWPGADFWSDRVDRTLRIGTLLRRCEVVCVGVDGGGLDDLFGLALLGREKDTRDWLGWSHAWCHRGVLERRKSIAQNLLDYEKAGELTIVDDKLDDMSRIVFIIRFLRDIGILGGVSIDPAGLGEFVDALADIKITQENKLLFGAPQGYGLMNAIKTAERKLANGTLRHAPSELMTWAVGNIKIEPTATAIRATKQNAGDAKIDPAMAMFDAAVLMGTNPVACGASVLKRRGLLIL